MNNHTVRQQTNDRTKLDDIFVRADAQVMTEKNYSIRLLLGGRVERAFSSFNSSVHFRNLLFKLFFLNSSL